MQNAAPPAQQNWLQEWAGRTPLVCRALIYGSLPLSAVSLLLDWWLYLDNIPARAIFAGELWRPLSAIFAQDGFITLLVVTFMLAVQVPPMELRRGSLPFGVHVLSSALLLSFAYALLGAALSAVPWKPLLFFGFKPMLGLWPVLLMLITEDKLLDPQGETAFLCFKLSNRTYPWFLAGIFSLISFFPLLDLFLAVALGHARASAAPRGFFFYCPLSHIPPRSLVSPRRPRQHDHISGAVCAAH
jgi:hypothetical protein